MRLAVYGTLRRGRTEVGKVEGFSLVFPGTQSFPALIKNPKGKGAVVELVDVDEQDLVEYDLYENVDGGLYIRTTVDVYLPDDSKEKCWVYVAGPQLWQSANSFTEVPDGNWLSRKTLIMLDREYEKEFKEEAREI
tara:strand:+ start:185 stop:592 length:408 start_codon:yes stop_codon:yes gene_type:complete